jgi:hypothetical protein
LVQVYRSTIPELFYHFKYYISKMAHNHLWAELTCRKWL